MINFLFRIITSFFLKDILDYVDNNSTVKDTMGLYRIGIDHYIYRRSILFTEDQNYDYLILYNKSNNKGNKGNIYIKYFYSILPKDMDSKNTIYLIKNRYFEFGFYIVKETSVQENNLKLEIPIKESKIEDNKMPEKFNIIMSAATPTRRLYRSLSESNLGKKKVILSSEYIDKDKQVIKKSSDVLERARLNSIRTKMVIEKLKHHLK